jgi:hypothetical protein
MQNLASRSGASLAAYPKTNLGNASCVAHSLAEVDATLTRLPGSQRLGANEALLFLDDVGSRLTLIALEAPAFYSAIASAAASNLVGGTIYECCSRDALGRPEPKSSTRGTWRILADWGRQSRNAFRMP